MRAATDPFSDQYERFNIAGLLAFDMGRMMGQGDKYGDREPSFRSGEGADQGESVEHEEVRNCIDRRFRS